MTPKKPCMTPGTYREIRLELGLTCEKLAELLGVSRKTIHMRESGKTAINAETALALEGLMARMGFQMARTRYAEPMPGRNDPCSCGSGRKFKKCCGL